MDLAAYAKALNYLKNHERLSLSSRSDGKALWIDDVPFVPARPSDLFRANFQAKGILAPKLTPKEKAACRTHGISFLTTDGSFYLVRKRSVLSIEPQEITPRRKKEDKPSPPSWLPKSEGHASLKPTHLISP